MTPEVLTALRGSIRHWRENLAADVPLDVTTGSSGCPLCEKFHWTFTGASHSLSCRGCPVMNATGKQFCRKTPYSGADNAHAHWFDQPNDAVAKVDFRKAAQAELDFLISLLPEGETP